MSGPLPSEIRKRKEQIKQDRALRIEAIQRDFGLRKREIKHRYHDAARKFHMDKLAHDKEALQRLFHDLTKKEREQEPIMTEFFTEVKPETKVRHDKLMATYDELVTVFKKNNIPLTYTNNDKTTLLITQEAQNNPETNRIAKLFQKDNDKYGAILEKYNELRAKIDSSYLKPLQSLWGQIEEYEARYAHAAEDISKDYNTWLENIDGYKALKEAEKAATIAQVEAVEREYYPEINEIQTAKGMTGMGNTMTHRQNLKLVSIHHSTAKGKKYMATVKDNKGKEHTIQFGAKGYQDFTQTNDDAKKRLYLSRHKKREDWTDPLTAGFWSRWVLWNLPTLKDSIEDVRKRFNL